MIHQSRIPIHNGVGSLPGRPKLASLTLALISAFSLQPPDLFGQGSLTPPGAPAPTMKTLAQIEPRTPISSLPFIITNGGSYYLTTNLTGSGGGTNGITITANHVTLDLGGFVLSGIPGSGTAINVPALQTNLVIHNGTIRGWASGVFGNCVNGEFANLKVSDNSGGIQGGYGCVAVRCSFYNNSYGLQVSDGSTVKDCIGQSTGTAILASDGCTVESCTAMGNGFVGISVGNGCTVKGCTAKANFPAGIKTGDGCTLESCTAMNNTSTGIVAGAGCTIKGCTAKSNLAAGIHANDGSTIIGCTAAQNSATGIEAGSTCTINGCSAYFNGGVGISAEAASTITGCTARVNAGDGILVASEARVVDNSSSENAIFGGPAAGIRVNGSNCRIDGNLVAFNNPRGIYVVTTNGGNTIIRNVAGPQFNSTNNYAIAPGNDLGPIGNTTNSTSPWANISH
jgi:parallel beta-helix repeat protein